MDTKLPIWELIQLLLKLRSRRITETVIPNTTSQLKVWYRQITVNEQVVKDYLFCINCRSMLKFVSCAHSHSALKRHAIRCRNLTGKRSIVMS